MNMYIHIHVFEIITTMLYSTMYNGYRIVGKVELIFIRKAFITYSHTVANEYQVYTHLTVHFVS